MSSLQEVVSVLYATVLSIYLTIIERVRIRSSTVFVHGSTTTKLPFNGRATSFDTILREQVPSLFRAYTPTWWLPFGDMQTLFSSALHRRRKLHVPYERKYILVPDGGCISLDITPPVSSSIPADTPIVIILHGLLGGSHVSYIRSAVAHITRPVEQGGLGLRTIVMNLRGCAKTPVLSALLYHPLMTDDLRSTILYISSQYPGAKLFALGFSLGAGYITNYLGEEGDKASLTAGFNVSNVWDYAGCSLELNHGALMNRMVYNPSLGKGHQSIVKNNCHAFRAVVGLETALAHRKPTMSWFTDFFMAQGVEGMDPMQFLYDTTCAKSIPSIRVPLVNLNARDDPLLPPKYLPLNRIRDSEHVTMILTDRGGHLGWLGDDKDEHEDIEPWYMPAIVEYFRAMLKVDSEQRPLPVVTRPDSAGMVRQVGKPNVGFLEVSEETLRKMETNLKVKVMTQANKLVQMDLPSRSKKVPSLNASEVWGSFPPTLLRALFLV